MKKIRLLLIFLSVIGKLNAQQSPNNTDRDSIPTIFLNNEITITAQRFENQTFNTSQSVSLIQSGQIQRYAPRSTPELLMGTSGVFVQKTNHGGGSPIIRGLMGNQVLLLYDGIRLNNATYRFGPNQYLATIDPLNLEKIEIIKGSGSVLYGSDALGGVLQLLSKSPTFSTDIPKISGSSYGKWMSAGMEISGRTALHFSSKKLAATGGFSAKNFGDLLAGGNYGTESPSAYQERAGDMKIIYKTSDKSMLTLTYQHLIQYDVPIYYRVVQDNYAKYSFTPQSRTLSYVRWEKHSDNKWLKLLKFTTSLNRSVEGLTTQKNNTSEVNILRDEVNSFGGIAEVYAEPASNWKMQSGVEFYYDKVFSNAQTIKNGLATGKRGNFADGSTMQNLAIFNSHVIDLSKFQFSGGLRLNVITLAVKDENINNPRINPSALVGNAAITYKFHPNHHLIINTNTGFRSPNIEDVSKLGNVEANVFEVPNFNLSPEKTITIEGGYKFRTTRFSGSITGYRTDISNQIVRVRSIYNGLDTFNGIPVYTKENSAKSQIYGIEAETEINIVSSLTSYGNISFQHGQDFTKAEPMRRIPPLFGKAGLRLLKENFSVQAEYLFAARQPRLAAGDKSDIRISSRLIDGATPSWSVINLYAGYSYRFATLNAGLQNLFNEAYRIHGSGVDGVGRSFWLALQINF